MERVKVIMQTQDQTVGGKKYKGMFDAAKGIYSEGFVKFITGGLNGMYRGTVVMVF